MIPIMLSLLLNISVPIDYYYEEPEKVGIECKLNRKQRRNNELKITSKKYLR